MENLFGGWQISTCGLQRNRKITNGRRHKLARDKGHHRTTGRATELTADICAYVFEIFSMAGGILRGFQAGHGHRGQGCLTQ